MPTRLLGLLCALGLALAVVPAQAAAVTVSMGDSYSSGEGAGPFDAGTADVRNTCHRSANAWPRLLGTQQGYHLACSGAKTTNLFGAPSKLKLSYKAPDNVGQLDRLRAIQSQTPVTRVLITIGGNDLGFGAIVRSCRLSPKRCLQNIDRIDLPKLRTEVRPAVKGGLDAIRGVVGPGAEIVLVGYPDLIPEVGQKFKDCRWLAEDEEGRLRRLTDALDNTLNFAANDAGARFVSIRSALKGHELCTKDSWVKPITAVKEREVQQMAHPTVRGQRAMKAAVEDALNSNEGLPVSAPAGCRPAASVAAIVDDSGSMSGTDPEQLRRRALELLITKPGGEGRTLGAVEFGSSASSLFAPGLISQAQAEMLGALSALQDDDGGTDYDAGFDASTAQQPGADARIFLTDGGHNEGAYLDSHAGGPRTYVIGLDIGASGDEKSDRLARIAAETGGAYFPLATSPGDSASTQALRLQPVFNTIDALLACRSAPDQVRRTLTRPAEIVTAGRGRFLDRQAMEVVVSWGTPGTDIDISAVTVRSAGGRVIADLNGATRKQPKRRKLVTNTVEGATFDTLTISRPTLGSTITVQVKAVTLPAPTQVTVQIRPVDRGPASTQTTTVPAATAPAPAPPPSTTPAQTPPPPAQTTPPPPSPRRILTVDNRVTNGGSMREDPTPLRLTTQPRAFCGSRGCNINGTERVSGQTYDAAECQIQGERITNGNDASAADDANPERFESTRYYGVRLLGGTFGYASEVWIRAADRGGLGLPTC